MRIRHNRVVRWAGPGRCRKRPYLQLKAIMHNAEIILPIRESPMSLQVYLAFVAACIALALLPGPVVTLVIANGLRHGTRAALTNLRS
jgi:hypothetical protein